MLREVGFGPCVKDVLGEPGVVYRLLVCKGIGLVDEFEVPLVL